MLFGLALCCRLRGGGRTDGIREALQRRTAYALACLAADLSIERDLHFSFLRDLDNIHRHSLLICAGWAVARSGIGGLRDIFVNLTALPMGVVPGYSAYPMRVARFNTAISTDANG
ncbi:hypothetical protein SAMN05446635_5546 [Burkholderia sp. OK233]|nr:hypothetical protein SAMN05446635_5546 [Burkholderia sp. OK233]